MAYIGKRPVDTFPANNAVTASIISANAVGSSEIASGGVDTAELATNAVTSAKLAQNSVLTKHIDDGQVTTAQLGADAVTAAKLADDAVVTANIVDANVTTAKIADSNVTTAKIADDAVTLAKMDGLARGKVIVGDSSGNPSALALGTSGYVLKSDGTDIAWAADEGLSTEEVQDIAGGMFSSNTETGITATYQDSDGTIDLVVGTLNQDTTGNAATFTATANNTADETVYPVFVDGATGAQGAETDTGLTYNPSSGILTATQLTGNVVGNVTGNASGTAATVTGGTQANITTTANLTTVGTIGTGVWQGTAIASGYIAADAITGAKIADDAIDSEHYTDGSIDTAHIADDAVTAAKLANTAVTAASYGSSSAIPVITVDAQGRITSASTATTSSTLTIGADSGSNDTVTVGTDTLNFAGTSNEIATTVSDNTITIALPDNVTIGGNLTVTGNHTVNGTTTTVATSNMVVSDNLIELNNGASSNANDSGIVIERGSTGDNAIFVWDESADKFIVGTTTATGASTGNLTITTGTLVGNIEGNVTGNVTGNVSGTAATVTTAAQTNITSLGTLTALTVDNVVIDGAVIGHTGDTDLITLSSGVVTVAGELDAATLDISGNADIDGTLEADAITVDGTALSEYIADTVGAMVSSNTESGITVAYEDGDNTLDFTVGTLNQDTTGNAATATALETARNIGGVSFDGTANINLPGVNTTGSQNTTGTAASWTTARTLSFTGDATGTGSVDGSANVATALSLAADSVDSAEIADGAIDTVHIADDQITQAKIADDAVGADQLAVNSVVSASIVNGSIVTADLADNSITSAKIVNGTIVTADIANNAILTQHIDDNQITGDQLADDLVLSGTGAIRMPDGTTGQRPGSPAAGMFRYNTTDGKFEGYTDSWGEIGGGGSNTFARSAFTGDGSTVNFTLSQAPESENNLIVFIEGVFQDQDAYSVSGTTLTFGTAPVNGRGIIVYNVKQAISGTNLSHNQFTGDGSAYQFTLSITPVHENNTMVYIDGVYQNKTSYTTSGTTLDFGSGSPPPSGSKVECMTMNQLDINVPVDDTVDTSHLKASAVTEAKIAVNAVTSLKIAENAITAREIATNAIATLYVADDSIVTAKIADNAVTAAKIGVDVLTDQVAGITSAATPGSNALTIDSNEHTTIVNDLIVDTTTLKVDSGNNRVGIGTASPSYSLSVESDASATWLSRFYNTGTTESDNGLLVRTGSEHDGTITLGAYSGSSYKFVVNGDGNVGIGETTPLASLHIKQGDSGLSSLNAAAHHLFLEDTGANGPGITFASGTSSNCTLAFGDSDSNYQGFILYDNSADALKFGVAGAGEKLRLQSDGKLLVTEIAHITSGSLEIGNGDEKQIFDASAQTIDFQVADTERLSITANGVTFNGDTAAANALDDYEEGTWTPTVGGASGQGSTSSGTVEGRYIKIGKLVFASFSIAAINISGASGHLKIGGFPFNNDGTNDREANGSMRVYGVDMGSMSSYGSPTPAINNNADHAYVLQSADNAAWNVVQVTNANGQYFEGTIIYQSP